MAKEGGITMSVKILLDMHSKKVLFAEAGKGFVDFLFHIMTLPLGTVIRLLQNNGMVGSVGNLYRSIQNINDMYMESPANKNALLEPKSPSCGSSFPLLVPDLLPSLSKHHVPDATMSRHSMSFPFSLEQQQVKADTSHLRGYVKGVVTYMVMDNLEVMPMSTISSITLLNQFKVKDVGALEEKVITIGMSEAVELLKTSLFSKNVLTDFFFGQGLTSLENKDDPSS